MDTEMISGQPILIVDDEQVNLKLLETILQRRGFTQVRCESDSRQADAILKQSPPALVLLDINMPHLNGFDLLERIAELPESVRPPVIMLTAQSDRDYVRKALSMGARDYVTKPFDQLELVMRVRNQLEAHVGMCLMRDQKSFLEEMVRKQTEDIRDTRLEVVYRLGLAAEYRDEETGEHIVRMSRSCEKVARCLGWSESEVELILHASPMHDIGKLGIPDRVLLKPGRLDPDEWAIMQSHTVIGARLLEGNTSPLMEMARSIALAHHEKWDGSGYPHGLKADAIPQSARIVAVADVFDALTSTRPYKQAWPVEQALDFLRDNSGSHFDPAIVEAFFSELDAIMEIRQAYPDQALTAAAN